jgi:hypothetical protein
LGELVDFGHVDHPPAAVAGDFDLVFVHHFSLALSMASLTFRTTPGLMVR